MESSNIYQQQDIITKLCTLGFTQLESEVYIYLLVNGENTGYAVAKGIAKAVANVYKGIEGLSKKGAIEVTVSDSKICSAVSWKEVLAAQQSEFDSNIKSLSEQLQQIPEQQDNESVYQMKNISQVLNAGKQIIKHSQHILVAELEPKVAEYYAPLLIEAAKRGVEVRVKVYQAMDLEGVHVTVRQDGEQVYAGTQDVSFKICADGCESITAVLTADISNVIQAFKTKSALVCMNLYCAIIHEMILTELKQAIPDDNIKLCQEILKNTAHLHPYSSKNQVFNEYKSRYQQ